MKKLISLSLTAVLIVLSPCLAQTQANTTGYFRTSYLNSAGFAFQGSVYKSIRLRMWNPTSGHTPEPEESVETQITANASESVNASESEPLPQIRKSELQTYYDQRLQRLGQSERPASNTPQKSKLQKYYDKRFRDTQSTDADSPRKSETQLIYDQRFRQDRRMIPGGADQPPIAMNSGSDGNISINGVEFSLKFVFYQNDFSSFSADVFNISDVTPTDNNRSTNSLPVPIGNLRLEKASDYKISRVYIGSLNLNDEKADVRGRYEIWLNDLSGR